jgi:SagB-type dehydrogenase family enzyme
VPTAAATQALSPAQVALAYHARTKHSLERYAAGPETLDWDTQPNPFREFAACRRTPLQLTADQLGTSWAQVYAPDGMVPTPLTIASVSTLMELSMGLSAWKEYGPDRWALRCNPSSGNLHPTEAYIFSSNVSGLDDGLHHYVSRDHALEQRCRTTTTPGASARLWIGLASVHWREAWKYGERAFRYCQLDIGHALGALRYAAAALGWTVTVVDDVASAALAALMGLDRGDDFFDVEREDADLLIAIDPHPEQRPGKNDTPMVWEPRAGQWTGRASRLDPHPLYRWPAIDQVSLATHCLATHGGNISQRSETLAYPPLRRTSEARAADIILGRRSAQRFDGKFTMSVDIFYRLLDCLLARPIAPWDVWSFVPRLHPILFIHRVEGLEPGFYALPRRPGAARSLRETLRPDLLWKSVESAPGHLPFFKLLPADCRAIARTVSCHQWIASDGCFSLSMLSEFEPIVKANAWRYRQLHWEAGLLGQVLYLEAEAAGLRGTGIGCYFDDALHDLLGIKTLQFQALYHFTVGRPLTDDRITTLPAYPGRQGHGPARTWA